MVWPLRNSNSITPSIIRVGTWSNKAFRKFAGEASINDRFLFIQPNETIEDWPGYKDRKVLVSEIGYTKYGNTCVLNSLFGSSMSIFYVDSHVKLLDENVPKEIIFDPYYDVPFQMSMPGGGSISFVKAALNSSHCEEATRQILKRYNIKKVKFSKELHKTIRRAELEAELAGM